MNNEQDEQDEGFGSYQMDMVAHKLYNSTPGPKATDALRGLTEGLKQNEGVTLITPQIVSAVIFAQHSLAKMLVERAEEAGGNLSALNIMKMCANADMTARACRVEVMKKYQNKARTVEALPEPKN